MKTALLDLCLRKTREGKSRDYRDVIVFEKLRLKNGLVWTVGLTIEIKPHFQLNFSHVVCTLPKSLYGNVTTVRDPEKSR